MFSLHAEGEYSSKARMGPQCPRGHFSEEDAVAVVCIAAFLIYRFFDVNFYFSHLCGKVFHVERTIKSEEYNTILGSSPPPRPSPPPQTTGRQPDEHHGLGSSPRRGPRINKE